MAAGMRVLETADASEKVRHHAAEEAHELPDTVTAGEASVSLDTQPRLVPTATTEECERIA
jgi:hypothetical protein